MGRERAPGPVLASEWNADFVTLDVELDDLPDARPAVLMVGAVPSVLHASVVPLAPSEPEEVAQAIAGAVLAAAGQVESLPASLTVRHRELVEPLQRELAGRGVAVRVAVGPTPLDAGVPEMLEALTGSRERRPGRSPERWGAWGLPGDTVAELFSAAAAFIRARPWEGAEGVFLQVRRAGGEWWVASMVGPEIGPGLMLCADPADLVTVMKVADPDEVALRLVAPVLVLDFVGRADLPPAMRKEIASAGWEVAGARAHPRLTALHTPAGGVSRAQAAWLVSVLRALARAGAEGMARVVEHGAAWCDPETGIEIEALEAGVEAEPLWSVPEALAPGCPEGPGADPGAALLEQEDAERIAADEALLDRFAAVLRSAKSEVTVGRHVSRVALWLDFLRGNGVPPHAATELDLRLFLYDWVHLKVILPETEGGALPGSLKEFFVFLERHEGVRCPWARPLLLDRDAYRARRESCPGGPWWDDSAQLWRAELTGDLVDRAMLHSPFLNDQETWAPMMGITEAMLERDLQRRWLLWRDEGIRVGITAPDVLALALDARQRAWAVEPHPLLGGRTPLDAIREERAEREGPRAGAAKGRTAKKKGKPGGRKKPKGRRGR